MKEEFNLANTKTEILGTDEKGNYIFGETTKLEKTDLSEDLTEIIAENYDFGRRTIGLDVSLKEIIEAVLTELD